MGDQALEFLRTMDSQKPFCLSISFKAPHAQDRAPREFPPDARDEQLYSDVEFPAAETATEEFFQKLPKFVQKSEGHTRWTNRFATPEMAKKTRQDYFRLITGVDREVGRILKELADRKLADNTIVVFAGDNGMFLGERGLADKWFMYEESIRVPLIIADLRSKPGAQRIAVEEMVLNIDVAPTLLEYAGLAVPSCMQGRSLRPLIAGTQVKDWRQEMFYEHHFGPNIIPPSEGVRTERWKYIRYVDAKPVVEELYDLKKDPLEKHNLVAEPGQQKQLELLREKWMKLREEVKRL